MMIYDLLGCGYGAFNISLNALTSPTPLTTLFLEKRKKFQWHPGMMIKDSELQVSWLRDCVSAVDPTSPFSFLNFIHKNNLFYDFVSRNNFPIKRSEYEQYLFGVTKQLDSARFGHEIIALDIEESAFFKVLTKNNAAFLAKNLSLGLGPTKNLPNLPSFKPCSFPNENPAFHSIDYLKHKESIKNKDNILIVGGAQSAVEIMLDILEDDSLNPKKILCVSNRATLYTLDDNSFINASLYSAYSEELIHEIPESIRSDFFEKIKMTSDGVSRGSADKLFDRIYLQNVSNQKHEISFSFMTNLEDLCLENGSFHATLLRSRQRKSMNFNAVIFATGFQKSLPPFLDSLKSLIAHDGDKLLVNDDYSLQFNKKLPGKIFTQNMSRHYIGPIDSNLSIMSLRNGKIVNSLMQDDFYSVCNQKTQSALKHLKW